MLARALTCAVVGLDGVIVECEVDISSGTSGLTIVGLPDAAISEARERVRAAIRNSGCSFPLRRITVNLAPADLRKEGPSYDLPIAIGILAGSEQVPPLPDKTIFLGELALDGSVRPTEGVLPMVAYARDFGVQTAFVPDANAAEAAIVRDVAVYPVGHLTDLVYHQRREKPIPQFHPIGLGDGVPAAGSVVDFAEIKGQEHAKRGIEVAAAGGHNILLTGPPGSGKTLLARAIPGVLPPLAFEESIELTKIYSVSGLLAAAQPLISQRPFRAPHHTISYSGLAGGGAWPRPGEITLSHRGVLFLDELPEFGSRSLEILRQPIEDKQITITRAQSTVTFPANFMLIGAMNPCPCVGKYHSVESSCPGTRHHRPAPGRQGPDWRRAAEGPPLPQPLAGARPAAPRLPCALWRDAGGGCPGGRCGRRLDGRAVGERRQRPRRYPAGTPD